MASRSTRRTWFITGASSGFGAAFVQHALELGDNVVATARRVEAIQVLAEREPRRVLPVALDVTLPGQADRAVQQALERFGHIDVLVNNAGYGVVGAVEETPEAELRAQMETNFFGAVAVMQAALPSMRARGSGAIVNMSSLGGQLSFAGFGAYSASKFALEGLSEALAQELAPFGLKVLIVEPGAFRTGFADSGALKTMPALAAYEDVVGGTRRFAQGLHGTQAGDPLKAARAVARALQAPETPLRLQLGRDAVDSVREHAQRMLRELATWEAVAVDTVIEPA